MIHKLINVLFQKSQFMDKVKLSAIKPNPNNPRTMTAAKLEKLKQSISEFTKMMSLRPIVVDENKQVLGGNQRFLALKLLKFKEVPADWIKCANDLTEDEKQRFIIADNVNFGEWDFEALNLNFNRVELQNLGLDFPPLELETIDLDETTPKNNKIPQEKIICCPNCGIEIDATDI